MLGRIVHWLVIRIRDISRVQNSIQNLSRGKRYAAAIAMDRNFCLLNWIELTKLPGHKEN